jgi:hypothetical protein
MQAAEHTESGHARILRKNLPPMMAVMAETDPIEAFIQRWSHASGSERSNCQPFVIELCALLGLPQPDPAREDTRDNAYVFERRVTFAHGDGSQSNGFIDCYRRGTFVLEAKKVKVGRAGDTLTKGFDDALMRARNQAEGYARALPAGEGRPPFLLVVDVGHVIELYAEFTRSGATYTPFPDARSHRLKLADLRDPATRQRLHTLWHEPMALDPARASARVTRDVAAKLATLARDLEDDGHAPQAVAAFLTRCLFCMFAEDVSLLPKAADGRGAFISLLHQWQDQPDTLRHMLRVLWADMDRGGFSATVAHPLLRFNGKLFKGSAADDFVLPLQRRHISGLLDAAASNWREVEPAIFGTLLERALDRDERHALGAHYTPRAYVERLVLPTVVEPLRADWADAQAAALVLAKEAGALEGKKRDDKLAEARAEIKRFHHQLCTTRVLDPACGSGNFLYVTLEHLKRLEGEVHIQLEALGETQTRLGFEGETVTPQQLLGIEINERAAALAELVLWIGYLQWHIRTFGNTSVAEPVIHDYGNIEHRDAVLAYDGMEPMRDAAGQLVQRWDGKTFKRHPVTGENVPDDTALVPQWRYLNPRAAAWPAAEFIVGNPPFIGASAVRAALGDGYAEALRLVWPQVPESADFVMHWWQRAAHTVRTGGAHRFGLITTNSLRQTFNRRVIEAEQSAQPALLLAFAIPDHPWVDNAQGAAVRIAMSVGTAAAGQGRLLTVTEEHALGDGEVEVGLLPREGAIHADLRIGADVAAARPLRANAGLSSPGVKLHGAGFIVTRQEATALGLKQVPGIERHIREYRNGRDLAATSRDVMVIDLYGLNAIEVRDRFPGAVPVGARASKAGTRPEQPRHLPGQLVALWRAPQGLSARACWSAQVHRNHRNREAQNLPVPRCKRPAGQHAHRCCPARRALAWPAFEQRSCGLGAGRGRSAWCRQRPPLQQKPLLRPLPLPQRRHRPNPRHDHPHPHPGRTAGRPPQSPASRAPRTHPHRHVQRVGKTAHRRSADRQGQAHAHPRPGVGAEESARRPGRRGAGRLRLARPARRAGRPHAARSPRRRRGNAARTPGGAERQTRRRRSRRPRALAAARLSAARRRCTGRHGRVR